ELRILLPPPAADHVTVGVPGERELSQGTFAVRGNCHLDAPPSAPSANAARAAPARAATIPTVAPGGPFSGRQPHLDRRPGCPGASPDRRRAFPVDRRRPRVVRGGGPPSHGRSAARRHRGPDPSRCAVRQLPAPGRGG